MDDMKEVVNTRKSDIKDSRYNIDRMMSSTNFPLLLGKVDITKQLKYFEGGKLHPYQVDGVSWLSVS